MEKFFRNYEIYKMINIKLFYNIIWITSCHKKKLGQKYLVLKNNGFTYEIIYYILIIIFQYKRIDIVLLKKKKAKTMFKKYSLFFRISY